MSNQRQIPIGPLPTQVGADHAGDGVVVHFVTPQGMNAFFIDKQTAKIFAERLLDLATGIVPASTPSLASAIADAAMRKGRQP